MRRDACLPARRRPRLRVGGARLHVAVAPHLGTHFTGDPGGDTGVYVWNQWVFHQELIAGHNPLATEKILSLHASASISRSTTTPRSSNLLALPLISLARRRHRRSTSCSSSICVLNGADDLRAGAAGHRRPIGGRRGWPAWRSRGRRRWSRARTGHFSLVAAARAAGVSLVPRQRRAHRDRLRDAALVGLCMAWAALSRCRTSASTA